MQKTLDRRSVTAVELPERHVMNPWTLVYVDASGNTIDVLSFNDIETAVNVCGTQLGGTVLSIDLIAQKVVCQANA